jgi:hypothetical protein
MQLWRRSKRELRVLGEYGLQNWVLQRYAQFSQSTLLIYFAQLCDTSVLEALDHHL